uniref:Uncharacterized protein n=1 Tax=Manihot esculenta TaxID=3983 RepID=A0A2C9V517_MANES
MKKEERRLNLILFVFSAFFERSYPGELKNQSENWCNYYFIKGILFETFNEAFVFFFFFFGYFNCYYKPLVFCEVVLALSK